MRRLALAAAVMLVCAGGASVAEARPGDLDRSFSKDGRLGLDPYKLGGTTRGLALLDRRRPLLSVQAQKGADVAPLWVTVSAGGKITSRALIPPPAFFAPRLADGFALSQYRIDPAGTVYGLSRLGALDSVPLALGPKATVNAMGVDGQGRVVLGGDVDVRARVWRFLPDGTPDTSFAGDGRAELDELGSAGRMVVKRDGRIFVAGRERMAALDAAGNRLTGFHHGRLLPPRRNRSAYHHVTDIAAARGGGFYVFGGGFYEERAWVLRLRADGRRDTRWGRDGYFSDQTALKNASLSTATVDRHGRLLLAGSYLRNSYGFSAMIVRLTTRGRADRRFATRGRKVFRLANVAGVDIDSSDIGHIALDDRGRIVVAGNVYDTDFVDREDYGNPYPAVARLKGT